MTQARPVHGSGPNGILVFFVFVAFLLLVPALGVVRAEKSSHAIPPIQLHLAKPSPLPVTWNFDSLQVNPGLLYARRPRAETLYTTLDLYGPRRQPAQKWPVVIYVHGGWWRSGSKGDVRFKPQWFVEHGFLFASVNYRLALAARGDTARAAHNVKQPASSEDVAAALSYLHREVSRYGGDSTAFFLLGHSAGGQIAALTALYPGMLDSAGFPRDALKGVAALDPGVLDIVHACSAATDTVRALYANTFGMPPQANLAASPLHHVTPGRHYPPFFLAHVRNYSYAQGRTLADRLHQVGGRATLTFVPQKTHSSLDQDLARPGDSVGTDIAQRLTHWMSSQLGEWNAKPNPLAWQEREASAFQ